jgi:predicted nucleotidyltransferase
MLERDRIILEQFAARVRVLYPEARIWAFGSRTRGDAGTDSDLDVCVVLSHVDADIRTIISDIAWEVGFDQDLFISTVVFSTEMFERGRCSASSLVQTIREEGVVA